MTARPLSFGSPTLSTADNTAFPTALDHFKSVLVFKSNISKCFGINHVRREALEPDFLNQPLTVSDEVPYEHARFCQSLVRFGHFTREISASVFLFELVSLV